MLTNLLTFLASLRLTVANRSDLLLEIAALRHQLEVLQRRGGRPRFRREDRRFWIWLSRRWPKWRTALVIVQPDTVVGWYRQGYRLFWRCRPRIPAKHIAFIQRISRENPLWGEDRIAQEVKLKLGIEHSASTIRWYMITEGR